MCTERNLYNNIEPYQPRQQATRLKKFTAITTSELEKMIREMPSKTCQQDKIPTDKLKEVLEGCLLAITYITNSSLDTRRFCEEWKEAIVKPLEKKLSGRLVKTNYRPAI